MAPPALEADRVEEPRRRRSSSCSSRKPLLARPSPDEELPESDPTDGAPDGGPRAWLVILGFWCVECCSFGWIFSNGVFQDYYERVLLRRYSTSAVAWISSCQVFIMFVLSPFAGRLFDSYGPKQMLFAGTFLHVFGLLMASVSTEYYQILLSQGICSPMGVAAIYQAGVGSLPTWFRKRRFAAFAIASTGTNTGGVVFPFLLSRLLDRVGFGWAMRIVAFLILALLSISNLTIRSRVPPQPRPLSREGLLRPLGELKTVLLIIGLALHDFGVFVPLTFLVSEAVHGGMETDLARNLVTIGNASGLLGKLVAILFTDRLGVYNVSIFFGVAANTLTLALWLPAASDTARIVFVVLYGSLAGVYVSQITALMVRISPFEEIGYRVGLIMLLISPGTLAMGPIAGAIKDASGGSYVGMKVFSAVFTLAGIGFVCATRIAHTGFVWRAKF